MSNNTNKKATPKITDTKVKGNIKSSAIKVTNTQDKEVAKVTDVTDVVVTKPKSKSKPNRISGVKSYKYIECANTQFNTSNWWFGRICDNHEVKVDSDCFRVLCGTCIALITSPGDPALKKQLDAERNINYPRGWKLYKVFVDENKNVYYKGVEQPELKGTLEPTVIEPSTQSESKYTDNKYFDVGDNNNNNNKKQTKHKSEVNNKNRNKLNDIDNTSIKIRELKKLLKTCKSQKEKDKLNKQIIKLEKEGYRQNASIK